MAVELLAAPLTNGTVPLGEAVAFWILGPVSLAGAVGMVLFRNAIHSALSLVATMMSLGAFYVIQQGPFLGLVQIIVYTGAIMILFLFVLMLVGRDSSDSIVETLRGQRWAAALFGLAFALLVAIGIAKAFEGDQTPADLDAANANGGNVNSIAQLLFTKYLFVFELTSALLIIAAVGAMVLAHIEREGRKPTQKSLARERIRSGRPQPLPGPGVLSTGNSIGTPALLPDGTISHESTMVGHEEFPPYEGVPGVLDPSDYSDAEARSTTK
ncbi:NADH dehydrogenase subunit J [Jatrophihabitans endophyticus]|uniref:NADH-quinone oxidoreductase subunit J n=1 Tax=Jatrophihabitans endophyticus TaxID=1206085 RepID=A0A1M5GVX2_9ACTN|nr:NADH-quinone oxidoreductase subunit J [Jatrophihabitans endophyticus]SHG07745.1 NADH dehydrogenase subunit J [Jatrophihabitans endophyticus]